MPLADLDNQQVWFSDTGGDGPPVLFAHGFLLDEDMWAPQVDALRGEYRCITYDSRSSGRTEHDGTPFTYWDLADDAVALLDHLGLERAVLVAMSAGGFMALRAVLRYPQRFHALAMIASEAGIESEEAMAGYRAIVADWSVNGPGESGAILAHVLIGSPEVSPPWVAKWEASEPARITHPGACMFDREDMTDRLGEIMCPVLVVHGTNDDAIPLERAREVAEGVADCREFLVVADAPHAVNLTHPAVVNRALAGFLAGVA